MPVEGPTQGAERHDNDIRRWEQHPRAASALRVAILLFPLAVSLAFTLAMGRWYPPAVLGLNRWVWIGVVFVGANVLLYVLARLAKTFAPLASLMSLSLVFPDQAPSRMKTALRQGSSAKMLRSLQQAALAGDDVDSLRSEYLVQLLKDMNKHDRLTRGHSERVRAYSELLGQEVGIKGEELDKLRWAALLHDVGKLEVPNEILNKDGRPDDEEWEILKTHPGKSEPYLEPIADWLGDWAGAATEHHARFDGTGYPDGIAGEEISRAGRLVAIADAYDVMTSARSYKDPLSAEVARQELTSCAGTQFDPKFVSAFLRIGLGDLRAVTGPWAWLTNLLGSLQIPGSVAAGAGTAASTAAAAATAIIVASPATEPPPQLAFEGPVLMAVDDALAVDEDSSLLFSVLGNDEGDAVTIVEVTLPEHGQVETVGLAVRYTPDENYSGPDTFSYVIEDEQGQRSAATVSVEVTGVQDLPTLTPARGLITPSTRVGDVAAATRVSDPDGDDLVLSLAGADAEFFEVNGAGAIVLAESVAGENRSVFNVILQASDGQDSVEAPVRIVVEGVSASAVPRTTVTPTTTTTTTTTTAAPTTTTAAPAPPPPTTTTVPANRPPTAEPDEETAIEDISRLIEVLENDSDLDGDNLVLLEVSNGLRGTTEIMGNAVLYTPLPNMNGADSFEYLVSDGVHDPVRALVEVEIEPFPDLPVVEGEDLDVFEDESASVNIRTNDFDPDGETLTYEIEDTSAEGGRVELFDGVVTYFPPPNFSGDDTIEYAVRDLTLATLVPGVIDIFVEEVPDAPELNVAAQPLMELSPIGTIAAVIGVADGDDDPVTVSIASGNADGLFAIDDAGNLVTVAEIDLGAQESVTYELVIEASDGTLVTSVPVDIIVTNTDEPPAVEDFTVPGLEGEQVRADLLAHANDPEDSRLTFEVAEPSVGSAMVVLGDLLYFAPDADFNGLPTVTYVAIDEAGNRSDPGVITIDIEPVNDAPELEPDTLPAIEDVPLIFSAGDLLDNDDDIDSELLPENVDLLLPSGPDVIGTIIGSIGAGEDANTYTFVPNANASGSYEFSYSVRDGNVVSSTTATIQVEPVNDVPVARNDSLQIVYPEMEGEVDLAARVSDVDDNDSHTFELVPGGESGLGAVSLSSDGTLRYAPSRVPGQRTETFTYRVTDEQGASATATVTINVVYPDDFDDDGDGINTAADVCPDDFDPYQFDSDGDGTGDACEDDPLLQTPSSSLPGSTNTSDVVVVGDIDGDGDLDIVVGKPGADVAFFNDGSGNFPISREINRLGSQSTVDLALEDLDRDGDADLVGIYQDGTVAVLLNDSSGVFSDPQVFFAPSPGGAGTAVAVGDIDGDGYPDIVVTREGPGNAVYSHEGLNTAGEPTFAFVGSLGSNGRDVAIHDLDRDGDLDVQIVGATENTVWANLGGGTLFQFSVEFSNGTSELLIANDFAGGPQPDQIWSIPGALGTSGTFILAGIDVGGGFDPFQQIGSPVYDSLDAGHFNGDGFRDLVAVDLQGGDAWQIFLSNGDGTFATGSRGPAINGTTDVAAGDFNGDGVLDIVTVGSLGPDLVYLLD